MMHKLLVFIILLPIAANAQSAMTAAEFDAYVTGKTLTFGTVDSPAYGVEQYLSERRVIWSGAAGACTNGVWFPSKGDICFRYDNDPEPKCWAIYDEPGGLRAVFTTRPGTTVIFEATENTRPLICDGLSS